MKNQNADLADLKKQLKQIEKAYGGCKKCYGKGYGTYRYGFAGSGDFIGEKGQEIPVMKTEMVFCSCDRGTQLKKLVEIEKHIAIANGLAFTLTSEGKTNL